MLTPMYTVGEDIAFRNMCQPGIPPFRIEEVNTNMFDSRYKVRDKWWCEGNLMPYNEWKSLK